MIKARIQFIDVRFGKGRQVSARICHAAPLLWVAGWLVAGASPGAAGRPNSLTVVRAVQSPSADQSPSKDSTAGPNSGITAEILISPVCPVERNPPAPECAPRPYQATVIVKTANGAQEVARATSDADGHLKMALDPGKYLLVPVNGKPYPRAEPQKVEVEPGEFTRVAINYDSGMR